jgi:formylglycine-generating enzyme required for sulfatase activity
VSAAILFGIIIHITIEKNRVTVDVRKDETPGKAAGGTGGLPIDDARRPDRARVAPSDSPPKRVKNSVGMTLVLIPSGEFEMGCPNGDENEKPPHLVRISRPFYLGACEVTQEQYETLMERNPSRFSGRPKNPVEMVSWIDAVTFCN